MRVSVSATFGSGSLPMSSAVMESTISTESFLMAIELRALARMPVTTMVVSGASVCASAHGATNSPCATASAMAETGSVCFTLRFISISVILIIRALCA
jgi:hypothetical protein